MRIPKRVSRHMTQEQIDKKILKGLVNLIEYEDKFILDSTNAIILIKNKDRAIDDHYYAMIHVRLKEGKLKEINRWYVRSYYFGLVPDVSVIKELYLFKVQNSCGGFDSLYDYKKGEFVIEQGNWFELQFGENNSYLEKFNGMLASFKIESRYEESDDFTYINPLTEEKITKRFSSCLGNYYAVLNLDGTIKGNKLFRGNSFSEIEEIIDLDEYGSLEEFKKSIQQKCDEEKQKMKQSYFERINAKNDGSVSPYIEVLKVLGLKRDNYPE